MGFLFLGISISLGIILYVVFDGPVSKIKSSYAFSLNETRTLDYSNVWCSSLSVESKPYVDAAFYLLDETPKLADHDAFNVSHHFVFMYNKVEYFSFYLLSGSYIYLDVCSSSNTPVGVTFLFIIGDTNLKTWQDSGFSDMSSVNSSFNIVIDCAQSRQHHFVSHVSKEDNYHIVFFKQTPKPTTVETSFRLYRTKLVLSKNDILDSCYTRSDYETCYLDIPYSQHHPVVLAMSPPAPSAEDEVMLNTYTVKFRCHHRGLLYIMMAIGSIILSFLVAAFAAAGSRCICYYYYTRGKQNFVNNANPVSRTPLTDTLPSSYGAI